MCFEFSLLRCLLRDELRIQQHPSLLVHLLENILFFKMLRHYSGNIFRFAVADVLFSSREEIDDAVMQIPEEEVGQMVQREFRLQKVEKFNLVIYYCR